MLSRLARQLRRTLGIGDPQAYVDLLAKAAVAARQPGLDPQLAGLLANFGDFVDGVEAAYRQNDRDLDLRSRSLALSSEELNAVNKRLREDLAARTRAIHALRATITRLTGDGAPPGSESGDDVEALSRVIGMLVQERQSQNAVLDNLKFALDEHAIVSIFDISGCIHYANLRFCAVSGFQREELIGRRYDFPCSWRHGPQFFENLWHTIRTGKVWHGELCNVAKDGHEFWLDTTIVPFLDESGHPYEHISICTDITESKLQRLELENHRHKLEELVARRTADVVKHQLLVRAIIDNTAALIFVRDQEGHYLSVNQRYADLFHNGDPDLQGKTPYDLFPADVAASLLASDRAVLAAGESLQLENIVPQGPERHSYLTTKFPLRDGDGRVYAIGGIATDITERKSAEEKLRTSEWLLREAQRIAQIGHWEYDLATNRVTWSDETFRLFEIDPGQFGGAYADVLAAIHPEDRAGVDRSYQASVSDRLPFEMNYRLLMRDGRIKFVSARSETLCGPDGVPLKSIGTVCDITEQQMAALAREQAVIEAENLARIRREFLANMSHEIRTPLNGVLGFAQIGQRHYRDPDRVLNAFTKITDSGQRLLGVINDVLDFSKIEAGKLSIERTVVDLDNEIEQAFASIRDRAQTKGLTLGIELAADWPRTCLGDPLRLGQVLLNLLSNAVKFTESGSITLQAFRAEDRLVFRVTDSGIGMNAQQLSQLFNPFHQADGSTTRRFGGSGLGLAICKRLLELMGGDIGVESQPGIGSAVEFQLPYLPARSGETVPAQDLDGEPALARPLAGISILVAEDDEINQFVVMENLIDDGAEVVVVGNGREALERIIRDGRSAYDVVLMDLQMPVMDGFEAARRILELVPDLPIIAQTAHAFSEDREKCYSAGMVGHICKPIVPDELRSLVQRHAGPLPPPPSPVAKVLPGR